MYIALDNIIKSFADGNGHTRTVLNGLDLHVGQGDYVAITGVSGTGKTTLLNILGTLLKPDSGTYSLNGETIDYDNHQRLLQLRNREIGFMFQDHHLLPQLSAWQNILLPTLVVNRQPTPEDLSWAEEIVRKMEIGPVIQQLPETLSGGEKSRVALCRALIMRPHLLLADEPTGQLDSQHAHEIASLLKKVNQELGTTVILVTHSEELAQTANHLYELKEGKL